MRNWLVPLSAALLLPALLAAARAAAAPQTPDQTPGRNTSHADSQASTLAPEAESLKAVCAHCHTLQMVMDTPKSYDAWHDTVQKMLNLGAKATDDQLDDIMDYLHRTITTIDVNSADPDELEIVLNVSETTAQAIVARREARKITGLTDLKSIPGVDASIVDSKSRLIFFK
jgi:DNA uptake protein ComE-like DNA-binding protein